MPKLIVILIFNLVCINLMAAKNGYGGEWAKLSDETDAIDSMMEQAAFMDIPRRDLLGLIRRFPEHSSGNSNMQAEARLCYWKAWVLHKEDPESAIKLSQQALELCDSAKFTYDHARFSIMNADTKRIRGLLAEAYFTYIDKLAYMRSVGDKFWEAKISVSIGVIMQELEEFHEAMRYYTEAQSLFQEIGSEACCVKNRINIANIYYLLGHKETALEWLSGMEHDRFVVTDSVFLANIFVSRFFISDFTDDEAAEKAYFISRSVDNDHLSVLSLKSIGLLSLKKGKLQEGIKFLNEALAISYRIDDPYDRKNILEKLGKAYIISGDSATGVACFNSLMELNDSLYTHERIDRLKKAEHLSTINRYEEQMREAEEKNRLNLILTISIGGGVIVILVFSIILLWISRRRAEAVRKFEEEKNQKLMLINRQYSMEIEAKEKELTSNTVLMSQKNAQLKTLADRIEKMRLEGEMKESDSHSLKETIKSQLSADDDWRYFKLRFDKVHPSFFTVLKERFPSLSKTELRLCAYIKVGMSAKEISQILSVKPETINTSRYRIRKKMNLPVDITLETALESIG